MEKKEWVTKEDFRNPENIEAAKAALSVAQTKADVAAVFGEFSGKVGHKVLGRILMGKDPLGGRK